MLRMAARATDSLRRVKPNYDRQHKNGRTEDMVTSMEKYIIWYWVKSPLEVLINMRKAMQ